MGLANAGCNAWCLHGYMSQKQGWPLLLLNHNLFLLMNRLLRTKVDCNVVDTFEHAAQNEVFKAILSQYSFSDGYLVFPRSRIRNKQLLRRLLAEGAVEPVD
jgi:hypothetical protein